MTLNQSLSLMIFFCCHWQILLFLIMILIMNQLWMHSLPYLPYLLWISLYLLYLLLICSLPYLSMVNP
jgi:hypothetical protein